MKKILSAVAALGLVVGVATTASALEFKVSGHYFVEGVHVDWDEGSSDSYYRHEFKIKPVMTVNDKITIKSTIYLAGDAFSKAGGAGIWGGQDDTATAEGQGVNVHHLYMEYKSPVGKIRLGRVGAGLWMGDFLSSDKNANRLMYFPNWLPENFSACVFTQKMTERDAYDYDILDAAGNVVDTDNDVDSDDDLFEVGLYYKTKDLIVGLAYDYWRLKIKDDSATMKDYHTIKGYYNQKFSTMYAEMEFAYNFGDMEYDNAADGDIDNFAIMADVGMTMDKLDVGMLFFYASGDDDDDDGDLEAVGALGEQFQPYQILTGAHTGALITDVNVADANMTDAGVVSLGIHADYAVSDVLSFHTALAYAQATDEKTGVDDEYGWEIDLGVSYNLMDNLTYQVDFGYLDAGDFFEDTYGDDDDVYTLTHRLTMEF